MVALERANIKVDKYYSSEVDKYAIAVSEKNYKKIVRLGDVTKWKNWDIDWGSIDLYYIHGKSVALCGEAGGKGAKTGLYLFGCITPDRVEKRQNGQRFSDGNKFYTLTAQDKRGVLIEGYIRKLTPIECERLQTLPDGYTEAEIKGKSVSDNQRYKMLGNGWTVDVIAHIFRYLEVSA